LPEIFTGEADTFMSPSIRHAANAYANYGVLKEFKIREARKHPCYSCVW